LSIRHWYSCCPQDLDQVGIDRGKKAKDLTLDEENTIRGVVEKILIEGNLKREIAANIKRLKDIKSYRGIRHMKRCRFEGNALKPIPALSAAMSERRWLPASEKKVRLKK